MADEGFGTLVTHSSAFFAEIDGVDFDGIERAAIESTHMATAVISGTVAARTFFPSDLLDWGMLKFKMWFNPDNMPPVYSAAEVVTLTCPVPPGKSMGATFTGSAFLTSAGASIPHDGKMTSDASLKWCGAVSWTPSQ